MSTADFTALALRIGLEGDELRAWVEEREARAREDRAAELEARKEEEELERQQKELEIAKQKTLQLQLKLAGVEKLRFVRENRHAVSSMSGSEHAVEGCYAGSSFLREKSNSLFGGGPESWEDFSLEPRAQPKYDVEVRGASRKRSGELDEADESFAGVEQKCSSWDGLYFGASGWPSTAMKEARVPHNCSEERASVVSGSDNVEDPLENSTKIVTNYSCGPLDAAACDMGSVFEDKLESHKDVTSSNGRADCDASCGIEADSRGAVRNRDEFHDANSIFESKHVERSTEKILGFGAFKESSTNHEVRVPLGNYGEYRTNFEKVVDTAECAPPAVGTHRADMVDYHADDVSTMRRRSRVDSEWICPRRVEKSVGGILLEFPVVSREGMVEDHADGLHLKGLIRCRFSTDQVCISEMRVPERYSNNAEGGDSLTGQDCLSDMEANTSGVSTHEAETFPVELREFVVLQPRPSANMTKGANLTLLGKYAWQQGLMFDGSDSWVRVFTSARRPDHFICIYTWKSGLRRFQAFRGLFSVEHVKISCRMVWDAIT